MKQEEAKGVRAFAPILKGSKGLVRREHEIVTKTYINLNKGKRRRRNSSLRYARSP